MSIKHLQSPVSPWILPCNWQSAEPLLTLLQGMEPSYPVFFEVQTLFLQGIPQKLLLLTGFKAARYLTAFHMGLTTTFQLKFLCGIARV